MPCQPYFYQIMCLSYRFIVRPISPPTVISVFLTKFCEDVYRGSASKINLLRAFILPVVAAAFLLSGVITRAIPPLSKALKLCVVFQLISTVVSVSLFFTSCRLPPMVMEGECGSGGGVGSGGVGGQGGAGLDSCSSDAAFLCGADGLEYLNPCVAGCDLSAASSGVNGRINFTKCDCVGASGLGVIDAIAPPEGAVLATSGLCDVDCDSWILAIMILLLVIGFFDVLSETTLNVSFLRAVDPKDKTFALGVRKAADDVVGATVAPIFVGFLIDGTCAVWGGGGGRGSCVLYDTHQYRLVFIFFLIITKALVVVAISVICVLTKKVEEKKALDEEEGVEEEEEEKVVDVKERNSVAFVTPTAVISEGEEEEEERRGSVSRCGVRFLPATPKEEERPMRERHLSVSSRRSESEVKGQDGQEEEGEERMRRRSCGRKSRTSEVDLAHSLSVVSLNKC